MKVWRFCFGVSSVLHGHIGRWNGTINKYQASITIVVIVSNRTQEIKGAFVYDNEGNQVCATTEKQ